MSELTVTWEEHLKVVRRVGRLEGAIEAHRILVGDNVRPEDKILYGLAVSDG